MTKERSEFDQDELAYQRTDLAEQRTHLAAERTFSAWLRTGLTSSAAGVGLTRLFETQHGFQFTRLIGMILVVVGGLVYLFGFWRYWATTRFTRSRPVELVMFVGMTMALTATAALAFLLILTG